MSSPKRSENPANPLYPEVILSNPEATSPFYATPATSSSSSPSPYPPVDMTDAAENLFPESDNLYAQPSEETLVKVPGAMVHLIQTEKSIELACGELTIVGLRQGDNVIAVLARVGDEIQWPLAKDEPAVKLDDTHYFFTLRVPADGGDSDRGEGGDFEMLNYGLTFAAKGQDGLLKELDRVLEAYSCFSVQEVKEMENWEMVARELSPDDLRSKEKKQLVEENSAAYWTALAPNVEEYSGRVARLIAAGSGQLIKGILWCGDVTVERLKWADEFLRRRLGPASKSEISAGAMERIKRVKKLTKMSEDVATGILSGVVKVSGFITGSIVNSRAGKKFFSLLPGEIVLASLDGFNKVCDAVEVAGKNVMSTTSVVTTGLVSQRYGEQAAHATNEGLDAAGHAIGTAWAVFKIRKAINPKSVLKPTTLVKAAAEANSADVNAKGKKNGS